MYVDPTGHWDETERNAAIRAGWFKPEIQAMDDLTAAYKNASDADKNRIRAQANAIRANHTESGNGVSFQVGYGSTGGDVKALQQVLKDAGYFNHAVTGYFGSITENALKAYQKSNYLDENGVAGRGTWSTGYGTKLDFSYGSNPVRPDYKWYDPNASSRKSSGDFVGNSKGGIKSEEASNSNYNISLKAALDKQMEKSQQIQKNGRWVSASRDEVLQYLDPNNYDEGVYKYQFIDLSASAGISEEDMAKFLAKKGILAGKANIYLEAARKYNVSEVYLAAHSALETGNGTSTLAKGVVVNGVTVYNMYGIGAYDSDPIGAGAQYAYKMGWTTPEKAIEGGAKWISEQYINNASYKQNTLYKMRWNPASPGNHQYATDVGWAVKQTESIKRMYDNFENASLKFDMPKYK